MSLDTVAWRLSSQCPAPSRLSGFTNDPFHEGPSRPPLQGLRNCGHDRAGMFQARHRPPSPSTALDIFNTVTQVTEQLPGPVPFRHGAAPSPQAGNEQLQRSRPPAPRTSALSRSRNRPPDPVPLFGRAHCAVYRTKTMTYAPHTSYRILAMQCALHRTHRVQCVCAGFTLRCAHCSTCRTAPYRGARCG